ncbi:hypothetical protein ACQEVM_35580 [Streptomyces sp. CA-243310]
MADDFGTCVVFHPPVGRRAVKWGRAYGGAEQIVEGSLHTAPPARS